MIEIKLYDRSFAHASLFGNGDLKIESKNIKWYRGNESRKICFFTDMCLPMIHNPSITKGQINIAWLLEPPSIAKQNYEWIKNNYTFFDYVLTYDTSLLSLDNRFVWYPHGGCWIDPKDFNIYNKSKGISIIASDKNISEGHRLRHEIINKYGKDIDLICGRGHNPIEYKLDALKDYKYSIVIENGMFSYYFTEKIIDCFVTGTVPIYWGKIQSNSIYSEGILDFNDITEFDIILNSIKDNEIKYENMMNAVKNNFFISMHYTITEDWIYENFLRRIV